MYADSNILTKERPLVTAMVRVELSAYLADSTGLSVRTLPTRCPPWTVQDITAHLAVTLGRVNHCLTQARAGDLSRPFAPEEMSSENLRAVREFAGDPEERLREEVNRFLDMASDPAELMAHPAGPVSVSLQMLWVLHELAVHHDDVAGACGALYRPPPEVVRELVKVVDDFSPLPDGDDDWERLLRASGR